jgi:hypothetical protein
MKTELLKKARKRFKIYFFSDGAVINGVNIEGQIAALYEFNDFWSSKEDATYVYEIIKKGEKSPNKLLNTMRAETKEEAINLLRQMIIKKLRKENPSLGSYKKNTIKRYF